MGRFLRHVQQSRMANPFKRGFSQAVWQKQYETARPSDREDQRIYRIGLWFDTALTSFRQTAKESTPAHIRRDGVIHWLVAMLNRDLVIVNERIRNHIRRQSHKREKAGQLTRLSDAIDATVRSASGSDVTPDQLITTGVDTISFLLDNVLPTIENASISAHSMSEQDVDSVIKMFQRGNVYLLLSELWDKCVHERSDLQENSKSLFFVVGDHEWSMRLAVSTYRQDLADHSFMLTFSSLWRSLSPSERLNLLPKKVVAYIEPKGGTSNIALKTQDAHIENKIPPAALARLMSGDLYLREYFNQAFPKKPPITINLLLDAWEILRSLSTCYSYTRKEPRSLRETARLACSFSRVELSTLVKSALEIASAAADDVVDWLAYTKRREGGLWAHPLIESSTDRFILCDPTLSNANMLRVVEAWIKESGLPLDRRGIAFKRQVLNEISVAIKENVILVDKIAPKIIAKNLTFDEQIDLIFGFCDKLVICEIKCQLHPYGSHRLREFYEELQHASKQILRKKSYVVDNKPLFMDHMGVGSRYKDISVVPIIITNLRFFSGYPIDGVPVCDTTFLGKVFSTGMTGVASVRNRGESRPSLMATYYTSEKQARERIDSILRDQLPSRIVERSLAPDIREYIPFSGKMIKEEYYIARDPIGALW